MRDGMNTSRYVTSTVFEFVFIFSRKRAQINRVKLAMFSGGSRQALHRRAAATSRANIDPLCAYKYLPTGVCAQSTLARKALRDSMCHVRRTWPLNDFCRIRSY